MTCEALLRLDVGSVNDQLVVPVAAAAAPPSTETETADSVPPVSAAAVPATLIEPDTLAALAGLVIVKVGPFSTLTLSEAGVEALPDESVALAVKTWAPFFRPAVASVYDHLVVPVAAA